MSAELRYIIQEYVFAYEVTFLRCFRWPPDGASKKIKTEVKANNGRCFSRGEGGDLKI
jgi:hypothetical protein